MTEKKLTQPNVELLEKEGITKITVGGKEWPVEPFTARVGQKIMGTIIKIRFDVSDLVLSNQYKENAEPEVKAKAERTKATGYAQIFVNHKEEIDQLLVDVIRAAHPSFNLEQLLDFPFNLTEKMTAVMTVINMVKDFL